MARSGTGPATGVHRRDDRVADDARARRDPGRRARGPHARGPPDRGPRGGTGGPDGIGGDPGRRRGPPGGAVGLPVALRRPGWSVRGVRCHPSLPAAAPAPTAGPVARPGDGPALERSGAGPVLRGGHESPWRRGGASGGCHPGVVGDLATCRWRDTPCARRLPDRHRPGRRRSARAGRGHLALRRSGGAHRGAGRRCRPPRPGGPARRWTASVEAVSLRGGRGPGGRSRRSQPCRWSWTSSGWPAGLALSPSFLP